jgi:hypothetical protein
MERTANIGRAAFTGSVMARLVILLAGLATLLAGGSLLRADVNTNAQAASLRLECVATTDGVALTWNDLGPGYVYRVESAESLSGASWVVPPPSGGWPIRSVRWEDARPAAASRFYRVVALPDEVERGTLLSVEEMRSFSKAELDALFAAEFIPLRAAHPVRVYRVVYRTVDPNGKETLASGALVAPQNTENPLPIASYQHGTIVQKSNVPSEILGEIVVGLALSSDGYLAVLPDYLGLGQSPGLHPYLHARTEATATIDLLRAARKFCEDESIALNGQLFLVGYSQGGHATLAAHRELEARHSDEFTVTASAPGAGPYDLSGVITADFFSGRMVPNPYYYLYLLAAYQSVYHFAESLEALLASPYDQTLPPLLDGQHSGSDINRAIGASTLIQLLRPEFLEAFQNDPQHPFRQALRENDLLDWTPQAPLRLYHCRGDQDVLFANSQAAYNSFISRGAVEVQLIDPFSHADHGLCAGLSLLMAKQFFDELKR